MAARRDPCRRPVFRGMRLRKQKSRLFCRRWWIYSSSSAPVSPPPVSSSLSALARCCQELLSSFLHRGLGMKGLTGVSLPVARHGGIVSKLLTHGSRALPAKGREEQGQRPEGIPAAPEGSRFPWSPQARERAGSGASPGAQPPRPRWSKRAPDPSLPPRVSGHQAREWV